MNEKITFETVLEKHEKSEATGIHFPFDIEKTFGARRVPVKVRINEAEYISTIVKMDGQYMMAVPKKVRDAAGIKGGETITVTIQRDRDKRTVEIPADLAAALKKAGLTEIFAKLSFTHQKEFVNSVNEAKKVETRSRRIEKTIKTVSAERK
jgi:uncharacterized protein YdeI (YjbR/CyaY-like superfamily)